MGKLITCAATSALSGRPSAQPFWRKAGVADRIDLRLGRGLDTLGSTARGSARRAGFDFAFIDADDKPNHPRLTTSGCWKLLRRGWA